MKILAMKKIYALLLVFIFSISSVLAADLNNSHGRFFRLSIDNSDGFKINFLSNKQVDFGYIHLWNKQEKSLFRMVYNNEIEIKFSEIAEFQNNASIVVCVEYSCEMESSDRFFQKLANMLCKTMPLSSTRGNKVFCAPKKGIFPGSDNIAVKVQRLMDAAPKTRQALYFPPGRYKFEQSIRLSDGHSLIGNENMPTIFDASDSYTTLSLGNQYYDNIINNTEYRNIVFKNMSLDLLGGTSNIKIAGNIFVNTKKPQPQLHIGHGKFEVTNNVFLRSDTNPGVNAHSYKNSYLRLRNNYSGDLYGSREAGYLGHKTIGRLNQLNAF